jgi:hypothetical protein
MFSSGREINKYNRLTPTPVIKANTKMNYLFFITRMNAATDSRRERTIRKKCIPTFSCCFNFFTRDLSPTKTGISSDTAVNQEGNPWKRRRSTIKFPLPAACGTIVIVTINHCYYKQGPSRSTPDSPFLTDPDSLTELRRRNLQRRNLLARPETSNSQLHN